MDSRNKKQSASEALNDSKPISAWERRKRYSKQMYDKHRINRSSENKASLSTIKSGNSSTNTRVNLKVERSLSLIKDRNNVKEEKQVVKRQKSITANGSLLTKKKVSPKRKLQSSSDGKENSEPKRSNSHFPVRRTSPRLHSIDVVTDKVMLPDQPSVPKLRRSASFTIDKGTDETKSVEGSVAQNIIENQDMSFHKNDFDITATASVEGISTTETNLSQNNQDMLKICSTSDTTKQDIETQSHKKPPLKPANTKQDIKTQSHKKIPLKSANTKQDIKAQSHKKTPLKSAKKVSLLAKKDKFAKPANSSGIKLTRREKLMSWKQQNNNCISTNSRRVTCGPAVFGSIKQTNAKQVEFNAKQTRDRKTLSSIDILGEKRISRTSKSSFTAISSKLHESKNSHRLSMSQKKNESSHVIPTNGKFSLQPSRRSTSNILRKRSVAANVERSVANRKTPTESRGSRKSILKNEGTNKTNKSGTKRKCISTDQLLESKIKKDDVSEQCNNDVINSGSNDVKKQLKYGFDVEKESTAEEQTENMAIDTKDEAVSEKSANDTVINHTPFDKGPASSRKKSVCFDVSLHGSTPGKTLPKTPKRNFTLRERLQLWLDNKGHSISNFRHVKCFGYHLSNMKPKKNLRQSHDKIDTTPVPETVAPSLGESPVLRTRSSTKKSLDSSEIDNFDANEVLAELKVLLANGHPTRDITEWLDELVKYLPDVEENPQYWICRSLVAELQNGVNGAIAVYHAALNKRLQCSQEENEHKVYTVEICKALEGLLHRYTENFNTNIGQLQTPRRRVKQTEHLHIDTPRELLIDKRNIFNSTVIKYGVSYNTPGSYKSSVKAVVTPVRRSARLSCTPMPKNAKPDALLESLADLADNIKEEVLFRENTALILD